MPPDGLLIEPATHPRQDCRYGLAAADARGAIYKIGGSTTFGRDYTKISGDGSELPDDAELGPGLDDWRCTRDNQTNLIWEVKLNMPSSLSHFAHRFTWYSPDVSSHGGNPGVIGPTHLCNEILEGCSTYDLVQTINMPENGLCGAHDWRVPRRRELQSLLDYQKLGLPRIDSTWFLDGGPTEFGYYSSATVASNPTFVWTLMPGGEFYAAGKDAGRHVRLVRLEAPK